ncbi:MAG TPA: hypothetical protein VIJ88_01120 [Candidatus Paceibacterota bacterium]
MDDLTSNARALERLSLLSRIDALLALLARFPVSFESELLDVALDVRGTYMQLSTSYLDTYFRLNLPLRGVVCLAVFIRHKASWY